MVIELFNGIPFGGDYCPDQWDAETWKEDIRIMKHYGVNTVTINVHSWVQTEREEGKFDFTFLGEIVGMLTENGFNIIMGTSTTAIPNWMGKKYPEMILTDINCRRHTPGTRENYCANSPMYREKIAAICNAIAEHFKDNQNIKLWHMANELGHVCYCENCAKNFRTYLKKKFGTLEALNRAWNTAMWGHVYTDWDEIDPPNALNELYGYSEGVRDISIHSLPTEAIEYLRFYSESIRECYDIESAAIRKHIPNALVTNNFQFRTLDYHRACAASDVISFDSYPKKYEKPYHSALNYDICRCLHPGKPFMIMEMTPNHASWELCATLKRPGEVTLNALKGLAHGADSSLFFQIRRSRAGFEKFHGAMIAHVGHENTRIGRELCSLGESLKKIQDHLKDTTVDAKVAVICDFESKFGVEIPCTIQKDIQYFDEVGHYYRYFNEHNIPVDAVQATADFSKYDLIVAPMFYMLSKDTGERLDAFVKNGGVFVATYYSGLADLNDEIYPGGYPGLFKEMAGIWVEETDALQTYESNSMEMADVIGGGSCACGYMCDVIHPEGASVLATYGSDFYQGTPCLTENHYGKGWTVYIGSKPEAQGVDRILDHCCALAKVQPLGSFPDGIEASMRTGKDHGLLFLFNHNSQDTAVKLPEGNWESLVGDGIQDGSITLPTKGSVVLLKK